MVTCEQCITRLDQIKASGQRADDLYEVGNPARDQMGHRLYFASDGRTALCAAKRRPETVNA